MKKIFVIDWILIPLFVFSAYTGIELHVAGHGGNHEIWHNWALFHVVISLLFFIVVTCHVATHGGWYKGLINKGISKRSKVTLALSVGFVFVVVTGFVLLFMDGANSNIGLWHYQTGLSISAISIGHILKRIPILRKSLKKPTHLRALV